MHLASFNGRRNVLENDIWEMHKTSLLANLVQRKSSRTNLLKVAKGEGSKLCDGGHAILRRISFINVNVKKRVLELYMAR